MTLIISKIKTMTIKEAVLKALKILVKNKLLAVYEHIIAKKYYDFKMLELQHQHIYWGFYQKWRY